MLGTNVKTRANAKEKTKTTKVTKTTKTKKKKKISKAIQASAIKGWKVKDKKIYWDCTTYKKAIQAFCWHCHGYELNPKDCSSFQLTKDTWTTLKPGCPLYNFRPGATKPEKSEKL